MDSSKTVQLFLHLKYILLIIYYDFRISFVEPVNGLFKDERKFCGYLYHLYFLLDTLELTAAIFSLAEEDVAELWSSWRCVGNSPLRYYTQISIRVEGEWTSLADTQKGDMGDLLSQMESHGITSLLGTDVPFTDRHVLVVGKGEVVPWLYKISRNRSS